MSKDISVNTEKVAKRILQDPIMIQKLSDRVLELLREDMRLLKERSQGYRSRVY